MLSDLDLQRNYRSGRDALLDDFYIPCLSEAVTYDRAVGYFSSSLFSVTAIAYSDFVTREGHMRLICSPAIKREDFDAMKEGLSSPQQRLREEMELLLAAPESLPATRLLATLIAHNYLEVQVAFADNPGGIFHDKLGIFEDEIGRRVSFVGSANETYAAWGLNHESFEAFPSWQGESDLLRTRDHAATFDRLWLGREPGVSVEPLEAMTVDRLRKLADADLDTALERVRRPVRNPQQGQSKELMQHQKDVLQHWEDRGHRGIVNFATGAGKTITAIEAMRRWHDRGGCSVVLVPGRDLHRQWASEIAQEFPEAQTLLVGAGAPVQPWRDLLATFSSPPAIASPPRIVLTTNKSFTGSAFRDRLRDGDHLLLVADEMHRVGSPQALAAVEEREYGGTLGLSATYSRQFDAAGTERLLEVFGDVLEPVVGLAEAIHMGRLVPYDYRLHTVELDEVEQAEYEQLTNQIRRLVVQSSGGEISDFLQMLLLKRARILKQAASKVPAALEILQEEYRPGDRWLVYCDDTTQLRALVNACLDVGLPTLEYHSGMTGARPAVLRSLADFGGLVVAIRCLDEGVDIPVTDHALILASSTVEREYVQRRGRVLRRAENKDYAVVHDLLLIDHDGGALTVGEALRGLEFARLARNRTAKERLKLLLALSKDVRLSDEIAERLAQTDEESDDD